MVVAVQAIRNAARSSQGFEPVDNARLEYVSRALQLFFRRAIGAECLEFRVDGFFEVFRLHSRARGRLHLKLRTQHQRLLVGRYIQRDLLFVDDLLVKPAGLPASQHRGGKVRLRITRLENGRGEPRPFSSRDRKSTRLNSSHGYISYAV